MLYVHHPQRKGKIVYFLVFLTLIFSTGCFHEYYKAVPSNLNAFAKTVKTGDVQNYYVLHHKNSAMHLQEVTLQDGYLEGILEKLPPERAHLVQKDRELFEISKSTKGRRYRPNEKFVLQDVHLFLNEDAPVLFQTGQLTIPLSYVQAVHLNEKDKDATTISHVAGVLLVWIPLTTALGIIVNGGLDVWR